jgi:ABC-type antimicrobial peptide transport system permease subunit
MRISIDQGRDVHPTDDLAHPPVIIVNERLARRMWPNTSAIGRRLAFSPAGEERTWLTVVGVAENVKQADWTAESADEVYLPYGQSRGYLEGSGRATGYLTLVVRSTLDAGAVAAVVRDVAARADRAKPVTDIVTMTAVVDRMTARARFLMMVLLGFAILAVALAAVGIYGVMSYAVAQRRQEIGIRIALGADARAIARVVMGQVALMSGVGLSIGLVSALGLTRFVAGQLYGVPPRDPVSFAAAGVVLGATALLATVGPLMRARRVDPVTVMRGEG